MGGRGGGPHEQLALGSPEHEKGEDGEVLLLRGDGTVRGFLFEEGSSHGEDVFAVVEDQEEDEVLHEVETVGILVVGVAGGLGWMLCMEGAEAGWMRRRCWGGSERACIPPDRRSACSTFCLSSVGSSASYGCF